ncbi:MAG: peptidyl-prolyl cis-trans isomerase [Bdellovibrionales bacterium]
MAMQALRDGASKGILKFFLLGILCLAGGGLVFTDVGGFFGGGISNTDVAKVGAEKIGLNSFDRVARRSLQQLGITPAQAYKVGYLDQVLAAEIQRRSLMKAANDADLAIGKEYVVQQVQQILSPAIASGLSAQQALENFTRTRGVSEGELTTTILSERTLTLFGDAMEAGALYTPDILAKKIHSFDNETRDVRFISFPHADFKDVKEPNETNIVQIYEKTKERFASPERRNIKVLTIKTDTLADTLTVEDAELKATYEDNIDIYTKPASRTIEQAVVKTEDEAKFILQTFEKGQPFKDGADKADFFPAKSFTENDILDELNEPVFSAEKTGAIGPIDTPLGWTVVNITEVSEEIIQPFEDVKSQIRDDIVQDQLIDEIYKLVDEVDEFFAVGGAVADAEKEFDLDVQIFENISRTGLDLDNKSPVNPAFAPDSTTIIQSAYELDEGVSGPAFEVSGGDFVIVNTSKITPKEYTPFEDVKEQLKIEWIADQRDLSNRLAVIDLQKQNLTKPFDEIAKTKNLKVQSLNDLSRDEESGKLSAISINAIFESKEKEHFVMDIENGIAIAEVTKINKPQGPSDEDLQSLKSSTQQTMQNELFVLYLDKLQEKYPAKVNERLLERVYGEQPEGFE